MRIGFIFSLLISFHAFAVNHHQLSLCTVYKNDARWIIEWLEYHRIIGVEHFYLYDNGSTDGTQKLLEPYIKNGTVEIIPWANTPDHWDERGVNLDGYRMKAFGDCVQRAKGVSDWLAIIDIDEFIVPVHGKKTLKELLRSSSKSTIGSLRIHWMVYGTSDVTSLEKDKLVTETFVMRARDDHFWHGLVKCIHRPEAVVNCSVHEAALKSGYRTLELNPQNFRINRYWTKAKWDFLKIRSEISREGLVEFNAVEDRAIFPYLWQLKETLSRKRG